MPTTKVAEPSAHRGLAALERGEGTSMHAASEGEAPVVRFARLYRAVDQGDGLETQERILALLAELAARTRGGLATTFVRNPGAVRRAKEMLHEHFDASLSLDELAAAAGADKFWLLRSFSREMGMTPHAYQMHLHVRTTTDAFTHAPTRDAIAKAGRTTLLVAGVATEIIVQHSALSGVARGMGVHFVVDACGRLSPRTEDAAFRRLTQAGVVLTSVASVAGQLAADFTQPKGGEALRVLYEMAGDR